MTFKIGGRQVGPGHPAYLIAEIGSNHDGKLATAKKLIKASAEAGADAVKFQSFTADGLYVPRLREGGAWTENRLWKLFGQWELPRAWLAPLNEYARRLGVDFLSTPFDYEAVGLFRKLGMPAYKIASGDMTHLALIRLAAKTGKPVLIATGMSRLDEVRAAVQAARGAGNDRVGLFHCVSLYPPRFDEMNLRAVQTLAREFGCPVGLSDHTPGHTAVLGAVALGATLIEKHVTLSRRLKGPDHPYALEMPEFAQMVREIRNLEQALGDGVKRPVERELGERVMARRGIYASKPIRPGGKLGLGDLNIVRPARELGAEHVDAVCGSLAPRAMEKDEPFSAPAAGKPAPVFEGLKVAVVGCGSIGRRHAKNLNALGVAPAAVCDSNGEQAKALSKDLGGVRVFADIETLIQEGGPLDAAIVCTPSADHPAAGEKLAKAGIATLMEKPLGVSEAGLDGLERALEGSGSLFAMAMCYRFHPGLRILRELVKSGINGKVLGGVQWGGSYLPDWRPGRDYRTVYSAQKKLGGGVLLDSIHALDLARWLLGEVTEVSCQLDRVSDLEIQTEDTASLILRHASGAISEHHVDYLQRTRRQFVEIICERGNLTWDFDIAAVRRYDLGAKRWEETPYAFDVNDMYLAELRDFLDCVVQRRPPEADFREGLKTLRLALAARLASREKRSVRLEGMLPCPAR